MSDPVAEFLAREKDELAGLEDESPPTSGADAQSDLTDSMADLGLDPTVPTGGAGDPMDLFSTAPTMPLTDTTETDEPLVIEETPEPEPEATPLPKTTFLSPKVEPEKIRKWREDQKIRLEQKDAEEEKKKAEWHEQAKKELDDWYKQRAEQVEKTKKNNKVSEEEFIRDRDAELPGREWERITRLCEFNPKSGKNNKDVSRLRGLLLQLKAQKEEAKIDTALI